MLLRTDVQLGWVTAPPSGGRVAVVEARCSDRLVVGGVLRLVDPAGGGPALEVDTAGADVTWLAWGAEDRLLAIGVRGLDSVLLDVDTARRHGNRAVVRPEFAGSARCS